MQSREIASNAMQSQRDSQNSTAMQCNFLEIVLALQSQCNPKTRLLADPWFIQSDLIDKTTVTVMTHERPESSLVRVFSVSDSGQSPRLIAIK